MTSLTWIVATTLAGGVLSVLVASFFATFASAAHIPVLISYAVGALLGAVFIELLPHAFEVATSMQAMAATILGGILLFFVLEKLVLWRHCHLEQCEAHDPSVQDHAHSHAAPPPNGAHDHGRSGLMILIGDTFHNFVDGILVAAAFLANTELGIVTALAIIAHEIPQEVGDFLILLHSGYTRRAALLLNMLSSVAMVVGGVIAYFALQTVQQWVPPLLGLAAASMLYVAVADLIPGLHRRAELGATAQQVVLIGLGIATIWLVGEVVHSYV
ncbi:MAG TPA: ZIP family metal transporter [Burkholderiales bacterium]|nr:ZIP family metal transporter [Burkholderiales bacterium]